MNIKSLTIQQNYPSIQAVLDHIKILTEKFRKHFKRAPSLEFIYSQRGDLKKPVHNLAIWFDEANSRELDYIKTIL